jgi:hydroxypyruvate reductase
MATARAGRRLWIAAVGKAAGAMARGAVQALAGEGARLAGGLVVVPDGCDVDEEVLAAAGLEVRRAAHPEPDERSLVAGYELIALARACAPGDLLLVLVSGGASALASVPAPGLTLADKRARIHALAAGGVAIGELNQARRQMSAIKGGQLARVCPAPVVTLVASDVPGDDPEVVGSGPTVPARPGDLVRVIAGLGRLRREAAAAARARRRAVIVDDEDLVGDVDAVAARVLAATASLPPGRLWIAGGEWTVALPVGAGRGGRARQLALVLARELAGDPRRVALVGASDGVDGTGPEAGAIVDGQTWARLAAAGIDADAALARRDAGPALAAIGASLPGGPTGVNHADLVLIVAR